MFLKNLTTAKFNVFLSIFKQKSIQEINGRSHTETFSVNFENKILHLS